MERILGGFVIHNRFASVWYKTLNVSHGGSGVFQPDPVGAPHLCHMARAWRSHLGPAASWFHLRSGLPCPLVVYVCRHISVRSRTGPGPSLTHRIPGVPQSA